MDAIAVMAFVFALVGLPFALPAFFRVLAINREIETLKQEVAALKAQVEAKGGSA